MLVHAVSQASVTRTRSYAIGGLTRYARVLHSVGAVGLDELGKELGVYGCLLVSKPDNPHTAFTVPGQA